VSERASKLGVLSLTWRCESDVAPAACGTTLVALHSDLKIIDPVWTRRSSPRTLA
jgi:hypothetical protein